MSATNWLLIARSFEHNKRIENLIRLYESHPDSKAKGRKGFDSTDILRAAVVLLHAAFEDMCRTVEWHMTPYATKEAVDEIPLKGTGGNGRSSKFLLGALLLFRGRTVDDVIKDSQREYLARTTYNSADDLCGLLAKYGLKKKHFDPYLADIAAITKRRHQIVHKSDRNESKGKGQHQFQSIGKSTVRRWAQTMKSIEKAFQMASAERVKNPK